MLVIPAHQPRAPPAPCRLQDSQQRSAGSSPGWRPTCWLDILLPAATLVLELLERFQELGEAMGARPVAQHWLDVVVGALEALGPEQVERPDRARHQRLMHTLRTIGR